MSGKGKLSKQYRRVLRRNQVKFAVETLKELQKSRFRTRCAIAWKLIRKGF